MFNAKKVDNNVNLAKIYCVFDSKGGHFGVQPFVVPNRADALRDFERAANDPKSTLGQYPADFTLFEIGTWDSRTGQIVMFEVKNNLGTALEFVKSSTVVPTEV